jgi:hypothetical protein
MFQQHRSRDWINVCPWNQTLLRITPSEGPSENTELTIKISMPGQFGIFIDSRQGRIDDDSVPHLHTDDRLPDGGDYAGDVHASDVGISEPWHLKPPVALNNVQSVERGR